MPSALLWAFSAEIVFLICCSETPAGVSEQLFHGKGSSRQTAAAIPLSSCRFASSHLPQGDGFSGGGQLYGIAKSRPLGEGGCERSEQTEGVSPGRGSFPLNPLSHRCAMTERVFFPTFTTMVFAILRRAGSYIRQTGTRQQPGRKETKGANLPCFKALGRCSTFWAAAA